METPGGFLFARNMSEDSVKVSFSIREKNIANIRKEFQKNGVFYSSSAMAEKLKSYLPADIEEVYDPTCGAGSLLAVFPESVKKYGQEIDESQVAACRRTLINCEIAAGNTLTEPAFLGKKFKAISANPPYSIKWEPKTDERFESAPCLAPKSKADYAFVCHILYYLSDDGKAAVLLPHGVLFRGNAEEKIRRWLVDSNYIERLVAFDSGYFVDTTIPTVALVLSKHKTTTDIYFEDTTLKLGRSVPLSEIQENEYNLNFSRYVWKDEPEKHLSASEFKNEVEKLFAQTKQQLEGNINLLRTFGCELEPHAINYPACLRELKKIIINAEKEAQRTDLLL